MTSTSPARPREERHGDGSRTRQAEALERWLRRRDDASLAARAEQLARRTARMVCMIPRGTALFDYDDAISLALLTAWQAIGTWDGSRSSFDTHIITRVRGAILDAVRRKRYGAKQSRQGAEFAQVVSLETVIFDRHHDGDARELKVADALADPRDDYAAADARLEQAPVLRVLRWLTPREETVLRAYYLEGVTHKVIAERLALSESRIHQLHRQALERARAMLGGGVG